MLLHVSADSKAEKVVILPVSADSMTEEVVIHPVSPVIEAKDV
jgi:hypothetical protein